MPVAVQREGHRIVARVRGNRLGIIPGMDGRHNVGVTEIMKAIVREIGVFQHLIQDLPDRSLGKMAAVRMRENQIRKVPVVPRRSERQFSGSLDGFVPLQHFHQEGGGHDDPPFPVLRGSETETVFFLSALQKLLLAVNDAAVKIHAVPGQPERFIDELEKLPEAVSEFDEALWGSLVEYVTVGKDKTMVFTLIGGTEMKA